MTTPNTNSNATGQQRSNPSATGNVAPPPAQAASTAALPPVTSEADANGNEEPKVHTIASKGDYDKFLNDAGNKVVLIEFYAQWCGPCKAIGYKLEELAVRYENRALILKVDVDDFEDIAIENDVTMMPTFVFVRNKKKLGQFSGSNSDKVAQLMEKFCPPLPMDDATKTAPVEIKNVAKPSTAK